MEKNKDQQLWEIAKARAAFRKSLFAYLIVNPFLIAIWFLTNGSGSHFWPIWPIIGWGISLAFQYYNAYSADGQTDVQREYDKIKNKQS